ncbi:MAG TPA: hypothetical protein VL688_03595 [Verrucomicrobiae bacterium]|nr:hypothetical protein [Verrucomicrobiae bacterium]
MIHPQAFIAAQRDKPCRRDDPLMKDNQSQTVRKSTMRVFLITGMLLALAAPLAAQQPGAPALNRPLTGEDCEAYSFVQERDACYLRLAVQQRSIEPCGEFETWEKTQACLAAVNAIRKLATDDCGVLYEYPDECRKFVQEGIPVPGAAPGANGSERDGLPLRS